MYILIYVDDIIVTNNNTIDIQDLITALNSQFLLNYFLGLEVTTMNTSLHLSQFKYLQSILDKVGMTGAKSYQTPLQAGVQLFKFDGFPLSDPILYRIIVSML
jgi:Reverse transcriptase (RNA-dependent DNA polymerase)